MNGGVRLDTAKLDAMIANARPKASMIVQTFGVAIAGAAAQGAPVDTSALRNSIPSESHMETDLLYIVQDGVEYGIFQELGTSKMAAQPFLIPAVEAFTQRYQDAFKVLFE